jgi:hypothetical protein
MPSFVRNADVATQSRSTGAQGAVFQVARLCDFTKSIVTMGSSIVCVLVGERGIR